MAIKGKRKRKSTARKPRTSAPKPVVVHRKQPLLARRVVQLTALGVVALVVGLLLGWGFGRESAPSSKLSTAGKKQVEQFTQKIEPVLSTLGTPSGDSFNVLPDLFAATGEFEGGKISDSEFRKMAAAALKQAQGAADTLNGLDVGSSASGLPEQTLADMSNARDELLWSLRLYGEVADMFVRATSMAGKDPTAMVNKALDVRAAADPVFQAGFASYQRVLASAETGSAESPSTPAAPPGGQFPSGIPFPSGVPLPSTVPGGAQNP